MASRYDFDKHSFKQLIARCAILLSILIEGGQADVELDAIDHSDCRYHFRHHRR